MSSDDENGLNPFADPSVINARNTQTYQQPPTQNIEQPKAAQDFSNQGGNFPPWSAPNITVPSNLNKSPPILTSNVYSNQSTSQPIDIYRREQELLEKERQLLERERLQELNSGNVKVHNYPKLPSWCPIKPCFRIAITEEINQNSRFIVKSNLYFQYYYTSFLIANFIAACFMANAGLKETIIHVILSIVFMILFPPLTFFFVFYSSYKAVRDNSQFNYVIYFVCVAAFIIVNLAQVIGVMGSGWCGIVSMASAFDSVPKAISSGIMSGLCSFGFLTCLCFNIFSLIKFSSLYKAGKYPELKTQLNNAGTAVNLLSTATFSK